MARELHPDVNQDDLTKISAEFEAIAIPLRKFAGD
jgi:hypothetical protein